MNDNNSFSHDSSSQFALSYELLHLLQWLTRNDADKLKKIIAKAIAQGLHEEIQKTDNLSDSNLLQDMHHSMIDFFELLDELLFDAMAERTEKKAREKNLLPTIDLIDSTFCDNETVRSSIEKTTKKLDHHPTMNAQEQLFKELLKKWKPVGKNNMN
jgi:hypothetical protein